MNQSNWNNLVRFVLAASFLPLVASCATNPSVPRAAKSELTPTGKLRVGLILANPALVKKDPVSGELHGVTVDLGREFARRLGVPFEAVGYPTVGKIVESIHADEWDIAFMAFDPERASILEFATPYMEIDLTFPGNFASAKVDAD